MPATRQALWEEAQGRAGIQPLPRLEWLRVDDWDDLDFCLLTVIITYFGVNYLMPGMHSYA